MILNKIELIQNAVNDNIRRKRDDIICAIEHTMDKIDARSSVRFNLDKLRRIIDAKKPQDIYAIAIGKAGIPMMEALTENIVIREGAVISNKPCRNFNIKNIKCITSSHPVPSLKSIEAARAVIDILQKIRKSDLIVFLISGGGSALIELPLVPLVDLKDTTRILIEHDLSINEINCIRKHLSAIKGGKIIKQTKADIVSLIISDVIGDDISSIASGLTYYDSTTFDDAINIIERHKIKDELPNSVIDFLNAKNRDFETLKKEDFPFDRVDNFIISNNKQACRIAAEFLEKKYAIDVNVFADITLNVEKAADFILKAMNSSKKRPDVFVFGGETTLNVKGKGKGGRNQELAMLVSEKIKGHDAVFVSFATDGKDGSSDAAGAVADGFTHERAKKLGADIRTYIKNNDSYNFFYKLRDNILSDDTKTNVADLQILIVG